MKRFGKTPQSELDGFDQAWNFAGGPSQVDFQFAETSLSEVNGVVVINASDIAGGAAITFAEVNTTFDIVIHYSGSSLYQATFDAAAARWEQIITADIPDVNSPDYGAIDDLLIDASVVPIDGSGGILGQAGPDEFIRPSLLPDHGIMQFDSADVANMFSGGTLLGVILHEIGHILGIGTLWDDLGLKSGFNYTGAHALDEYRTLTGNPAQSAIPLETGGGPGTRGSHWSEAVFNTELMTGYAEASGTAMPLSRMTVAALWDLGYTVDLAAADPYTLPGGGGGPTDDYAGNTTTIGQVAVGGSTNGNIQFLGDRDWFRAQLNTGATYTIDLEGAPTGAGTLGDTFLYLYNSAGQQLNFNDDGGAGLNSLLVFTPSASGTYYFGASAYDDQSTGTYRVSVTSNTTNQSPAITSNGGGDTASVSVAENTTAVTTVAASDPDVGDTLTYSIAGGADAARFQIGATTGVLSFISVPNFEAPADSGFDNSYVVIVQASDGGLSDTQTLTVDVTDVGEANAAPTDMSLSNLSIAENKTGAAIGNLTVADPNGDSAFTFVLSDARFTVTGSPGNYQLALGALSTLDFETEPSVMVQVTAFDGGGLSYAENFTITVVDAAGVTIIGSNQPDIIDATHTAPGQPLPTDENDTISGFKGDDTISGLGGADVVDGGGGIDTLNGGDGDDVFVVNGENNYFADVFHGDAGNDTFLVSGKNAVALNGLDAVASSIENWLGNGHELLGTRGGEVFDLSSLTSITGLTFIDAGKGNDTVVGSNLWNGDLRGGVGSDTLHGGSGDDKLSGGKDKITDTFVFDNGDGHDTIMDLTFDKKTPANDDHIDLSGRGLSDYTTDVHAHMTQVGKNVLIDFGGGDTLTILKTTIAILDAHASDFILV